MHPCRIARRQTLVQRPRVRLSLFHFFPNSMKDSTQLFDQKNKNSYVDQLNQILHYLGTPSEDTLRRVGSPRAQEYIRSLPIKPRIPFQTLYPSANPEAIDLLSKMLAFDPAKRISCEQALNHPYLAVWHDPQDEPNCDKVRFSSFSFSFLALVLTGCM